MELVIAFIAAMGIPSAFMGFIVWLLKRSIDKREAKREEREENVDKLMIMMLQNTRACCELSKATACAVQRIPDAHCNGDMKAALERAEKMQNEEKEYLINQGVKHIFGD